jgi:hypothetical protein
LPLFVGSITFWFFINFLINIISSSSSFDKETCFALLFPKLFLHWQTPLYLLPLCLFLPIVKYVHMQHQRHCCTSPFAQNATS